MKYHFSGYISVFNICSQGTIFQSCSNSPSIDIWLILRCWSSASGGGAELQRKGVPALGRRTSVIPRAPAALLLQLHSKAFRKRYFLATRASKTPKHDNTVIIQFTTHIHHDVGVFINPGSGVSGRTAVEHS